MKRSILCIFMVLCLCVGANAAPATSVGVTIFEDNMENGPGDWIDGSTYWQWASGDLNNCANANSGSASWFLGSTSNCNSSSSVGYQWLRTPNIVIPAAGNTELNFAYYQRVAGSNNRIYIHSQANGYTQLGNLSAGPTLTWANKQYNVPAAYKGQTVLFLFYFSYSGTYIDDIKVENFPATYYNGAFTSPAFNWNDISDSANLLTTSELDDGWKNVNMGFSFTFYGQTYTDVDVSTNGYLTFGSDPDNYTADSIPDTNDPDNIIAPFWCDLDLSGGGEIFAKTMGTAPNRQFIVQYKNVDFYDASERPGNALLNFEVILSEADNSILFQYGDMLSVNSHGNGDGGDPDGDDTSIGIENADGGLGVNHSYNTASITDNMALKIEYTDTDTDSLPDFFEFKHNTDHTNINDPTITADVDGDGLNWLQEYQGGSNPYYEDSDFDGVDDPDEIAGGSNPMASEIPLTITYKGTGTDFGTAYFAFTVGTLDPDTTGFRVYYGAASLNIPTVNVTSDYDAYYDIIDTTQRSGLIDQKWGLNGVPLVYFRVAPIRTVNGVTFEGTPTREYSTYFAGYGDKNGLSIADTNQADEQIQELEKLNNEDDDNKFCFISSASGDCSFKRIVSRVKSFFGK